MADESCMDIKLLISLIEQRPVLWDKTSVLYKHRAATQAAWREVTAALNPDFESHDEDIKHAYAKLAMQRWTHVRDNYHKYLKKVQEQKSLGSCTKRVKPYIYCKHLRFMQKVLKPDATGCGSSAEHKNKVSETQEDIVYHGRLETQSMNVFMPKPITAHPIHKRSLNRDINPLEVKITRTTEPNVFQEPEENNRHLSFFKGILPTLDNFNDNEVLEFQIGVLNLLKNIKSNRLSVQLSSSASPSSSQRAFEPNMIKQEFQIDNDSSNNIIKIENPEGRQSVNSFYSNYSE